MKTARRCSDLAADSRLGPLRQVSSREQAKALLDAIEKLPADQREAFLFAGGRRHERGRHRCGDGAFRSETARAGRCARNKLKELLADFAEVRVRASHAIRPTSPAARAATRCWTPISAGKPLDDAQPSLHRCAAPFFAHARVVAQAAGTNAIGSTRCDAEAIVTRPAANDRAWFWRAAAGLVLGIASSGYTERPCPSTATHRLPRTDSSADLATTAERQR